MYERDIKSYAAFQDAKVLQARRGSIQELQAQIEAAKARQSAEEKLSPDMTAGERAKLASETFRTIQDLSNQIKVKILDDQRSMMEAKLATIKEGTVEELEERKRIAAKSTEIELSQLGISEDKKNSIRAKSKQEQIEFDRQIEDKRLEIQLNGIATALTKSKEGSLEEFNLKLDQLKKQQEIDLNAKGLTDDKRLLIEAKYQKDVLNLTKETNSRILQEAINTKQSEVNARLSDIQSASLSQTNADLLNLKKESIDQQETLDILTATNVIHNESELAAKIKEIRAKSAADKRAIDDEAYKQTTQYQLDISNLELENEKKKAQLILNGSGSSLSARITAGRRIKEIAREEVDNELKALNDLHNNKKISEEEFQKQYLAIQGKYLDQQLEQQQQKEALKQQIVQGGFDIIKTLADNFFESQAESRQADLDDELAKLEDQKAKEVDNKNLTEQQKADIDKRYKAKEAQVKLQAWLADQQAKKQQAIVNGFLAVTQTFATLGWPAAILPSLFVAAQTAILVNKISQAKPPKFRKGGYTGDKGRDEIAGEVHGQEYVAHADATKKYRPALEAINSMKFDEYLISLMPSVNQEVISNSYINASGSMQLDYDKIGKSVAKHMPAPVNVHNSWDEDGFTSYTIEKGNKRTIRNKKYKMG